MAILSMPMRKWKSWVSLSLQALKKIPMSKRECQLVEEPCLTYQLIIFWHDIPRAQYRCRKMKGVPTLMYGIESLAPSSKDIHKLSSVATNTLKSVLGIPKRSHHSAVLEALKIPPISDEIMHSAAGLYHRIFKEDSPVRDLQAKLLSRQLVTGSCVKGTLLGSLLNFGLNPVNVIYEKPNCRLHSINFYADRSDGVVDSLRYLLFHENFIKPWSHEFMLVTFLTKAF
jgi:hypothetical protein